MFEKGTSSLEYPPLVPMPERMQETFDWFREMRASHPVYYDAETTIWHLFRQQDVRSALANYQQFSSEPAAGSDFSDAFSLVFMDPPRHDELRALIAQAFTPRSIAQLAPTIRERVDHLLEPVRAKGQMDFIHDFAYPLPAIVIADLLGVPVEDRDLLKGWADAFIENGFASLIGWTILKKHRRPSEPYKSCLTTTLQSYWKSAVVSRARI